MKVINETIVIKKERVSYGGKIKNVKTRKLTVYHQKYVTVLHFSALSNNLFFFSSDLRLLVGISTRYITS